MGVLKPLWRGITQQHVPPTSQQPAVLCAVYHRVGRGRRNTATHTNSQRNQAFVCEGPCLRLFVPGFIPEWKQLLPFLSLWININLLPFHFHQLVLCITVQITDLINCLSQSSLLILQNKAACLHRKQTRVQVLSQIMGNILYE